MTGSAFVKARGTSGGRKKPSRRVVSRSLRVSGGRLASASFASISSRRREWDSRFSGRRHPPVRGFYGADGQDADTFHMGLTFGVSTVPDRLCGFRPIRLPEIRETGILPASAACKVAVMPSAVLMAGCERGFHEIPAGSAIFPIPRRGKGWVTGRLCACQEMPGRQHA